VTPDCEHLDAFLVGDLPPAAQSRFEAHLATCAECREAVEEQRWIDGLLQSDAAAMLEPAPASLTTQRDLTTRRRQRITRYVASLVAVAVALPIAAFSWQLLAPTQEHAAPSNNQLIAPDDPSPSATLPVLANAPINTNRARFTNRSDTIALSIESDDDNVSIVQLVPTTQTDRRIRSELILQALELESNGG